MYCIVLANESELSVCVCVCELILYTKINDEERKKRHKKYYTDDNKKTYIYMYCHRDSPKKTSHRILLPKTVAGHSKALGYDFELSQYGLI